jgi:hypothetical protein
VLKRLAFLALAAVAAPAWADPMEDLRAAVDTLREAKTFAWETTARQTWREYPDYATPPDLADRTAAIEVSGKVGNGFYQVTLLPSKTTLEVPVTAIVKSSIEALADTPIGWMTRQEMRDSPRRGETVKIEGKSIRLFRFFAVATRASNVESPLDELVGLLADLKSVEAAPGGIVGHMKAVNAGMLQERGPGAINSADDIRGSIFFRVRDGRLVSYEVRLMSEIPRVGRDPIKSTSRWTTTISSVGSASVLVPYEARKRFDALAEEVK